MMGDMAMNEVRTRGAGRSMAAYSDKSALPKPVQADKERVAGPVCDVLVHLDGSGQDVANLAHAEMIATVFGAHVRGVFTHVIPSALVSVGPDLGQLSAAFWRDDAALADTAEQQARQRLLLLDAATDLLRADGLSHEIGRTLAQLSRAVDMVVLGRPQGGAGPDLLESVLFDAGAVVFVVPPEAVQPKDPETIVIGWRDTTECSHAIAAALPFLQNAGRVHLVEVAEGSADDEDDSLPAADMARHLARHGVSVDVRRLSHPSSRADALLNEAAILGADLIVIGAYGHSRLREMLLGGVTRELLTRSTVPLLMAH
ncbi:universal stress protein UspA [Aureimonas glaciei]|uniref:Universal stress protein UspA n=2 Tax=Aureimonas glaciei TaxID=1776957 RepID=A0A916XUH2_9HYPH|nr:universal stress protein UspA [Aureimonas glaciei]